MYYYREHDTCPFYSGTPGPSWMDYRLTLEEGKVASAFLGRPWRRWGLVSAGARDGKAGGWVCTTFYGFENSRPQEALELQIMLMLGLSDSHSQGKFSSKQLPSDCKY